MVVKPVNLPRFKVCICLKWKPDELSKLRLVVPNSFFFGVIITATAATAAKAAEAMVNGGGNSGGNSGGSSGGNSGGGGGGGGKYGEWRRWRRRLVITILVLEELLLGGKRGRDFPVRQQ